MCKSDTVSLATATSPSPLASTAVQPNPNAPTTSLSVAPASPSSCSEQEEEEDGSVNISSAPSSRTSTPVAKDEAPLSFSKGKHSNAAAGATMTRFYWSDEAEPHAARRKAILAKYPEIKKLYGPDWQLKYVCTALVALQIVLASTVAPALWKAGSIARYVMLAWVVGGTANHMLLLGMHELSHNLGFVTPLYNRLFGICVANLPIGFATCVTFKRYHLDHHKYQGEIGIDVDIPTLLEGRIFQSTVSKFFFVTFQIVFYAFRPMVVNPKKPIAWEYFNWFVCILFNSTLVYTCGFSALFYLWLSSFLGTGLHPVAGHFLSEHYVMKQDAATGQPEAETYSYYGPLNIFAFNVGYHNEHHDFPFVAGRHLPTVRKIAAEFYDPLPVCESWPGVLYKYIVTPSVTAFSRVQRHELHDAALVESLGQGWRGQQAKEELRKNLSSSASSKPKKE